MEQMETLLNKLDEILEVDAMREVRVERNTTETQIDLTLDLDGAGIYQVDTGCGFLNHMLELFARHGRFDLVLTCHGDVEVDYHHTAEDIGIALGQAFRQGLGDMRGIQRYGSFYLPMDEALILCAVDLSGRCTLNWSVHCPPKRWGTLMWSAPRSSGWALPAASPPPSTLSSSPERTATTFWRPATGGGPGPGRRRPDRRIPPG